MERLMILSQEGISFFCFGTDFLLLTEGGESIQHYRVNSGDEIRLLEFIFYTEGQGGKVLKEIYKKAQVSTFCGFLDIREYQEPVIQKDNQALKAAASALCANGHVPDTLFEDALYKVVASFTGVKSWDDIPDKWQYVKDIYDNLNQEDV